MSTSAEANVARRRPGGRTADVTARVHKAVTDLIMEGGLQACTFSAVAERAGIERSTLYRRFPDRWDAIIDAWMTRAATEVMPDLGHSFAEDLKSVLHRLVDTLEPPVGPAFLSVVAELRNKAKSEYDHAFFDRRMVQLEPMFDAAIARGELDPDVDREALFSFAAGPIYFRMFIASREVDQAFIDQIIDNVRRLYCS
jgi:AcrR family transcriptional regulator